jgi:HAE1 family hydrophobic/amphiphilic exporter-1
MRIVSLVLLGAICLGRLPVDMLPRVSIPTVAISTSWPNTAPEVMEAQITRPIEEAVSGVQNLYQINSSSIQGSSLVRVQFNWGTDIGQAAVDTLQLLGRAEQQFPTNEPTLALPVVYKFDPTQIPILIYGVSGMKDEVKLYTLLNNEIAPMIEGANGVASAVITGGLPRAILVSVDTVKLQAHGIPLSAVANRIAQENVNLPAGIGKQGDTEYTIRTLGWVTSAEDTANLPLGTYNGQLVKLGDVATVTDSHDEQRVFARYNEEPAVGMSIIKQSDANTVATAGEVKKKIAEIQKMYPALKWGIAYNQAQYIDESINDLRDNAIIGGLLAVLILLFFLRNFRSTLVVALSIPISIVSTFALLYMCGYTLNTMSLGGLSLSTGLIVDDAVVVLENIFRHIERDKKTTFNAAVDGTNEIISAVFASTWTIMVVFLPLMLIKGQAGQMFTQFAFVVIFALAMSLLDATTVVPMLATKLIKGEAHAEAMNGEGAQRGIWARMFFRFGQWFDALDRSYRQGLQWAIHHRWMVGLGAATLIVAVLPLTRMIGTELMPVTDSGDFQVQIKLPVGTALAKTNETMKQVEKILHDDPDVETAFSAAGTTISLRGASTTQYTYQGGAAVKLKDNHKRSTLNVINDLRKKFSALPGVNPLITQLDLTSLVMTGGPQTLEVDVFGQNLDTLSKISKDIMQRVRGIGGFENVDVNWDDATPEIRWQVDRQKTNQLGLSFSDIANTIYTATGANTAVSYYQESGYQYPIIVELPMAERKTVSEMSHMIIASSSAGATLSNGVLLTQVAKPVYALGPSMITRQNRQRYIAITGMPMGRSEGEVQADIEKAIAPVTSALPQGYHWEWGTNQKRRAEEFGGLDLAIVLAIALIYMLLAAQFEHFLHPLTILLTVPLSITGVILALFLTGRHFGLTAFIGLLMLIGIVVKNGILLVDYTNHLRKTGLSRDEALLRAGPTRLRPILMTASAAILGMLPIALALGRGSETNAPMATVVIGGLATSTVMTLFVVPVVYSALDDLANLLAGKHDGVEPKE